MEQVEEGRARGGLIHWKKKLVSDVADVPGLAGQKG